MKRKFYITVSAFSLAALVGTAGASDFENLSVFATFVATLVWTALFVGFGTLAIKTPAKKEIRGMAVPTEHTKNNYNHSVAERNRKCK